MDITKIAAFIRGAVARQRVKALAGDIQHHERAAADALVMAQAHAAAAARLRREKALAEADAITAAIAMADATN